MGEWTPEGNQSQIDNAMTVNGNDVTFHLVTPYAGFLYLMAYTVGSIVEKSYVEAHGGIVNDQQNEWMNRHEMGTGPFKFVEWVPSQYMRMDRFDQYWQGPAALKHVIIREVNDIGSREMQLFSGDADCAAIDTTHKQDVIGKTGLRIVEGLPTFTIGFIGLNQFINDGVHNIDIGDVPATFFSDVHVRKAFVASWNYESYIHNAIFDSAVHPNGMIPNGMFGYNSTVPEQQYDLAVAESELKLALDTRTPDPDDTYWDNGFTLNIYIYNGDKNGQLICEMLKYSLESLNPKISINFDGLEWGSLMLPALFNGELPMMELTWQMDYPDPDDFAIPLASVGGSYSSLFGLSNATLSQLIRDAAQETDLTLRAEMYYDISMSMYENAYYIWVEQPTTFHVERDWVQGYYYNPTYSGLYYYALSKG